MRVHDYGLAVACVIIGVAFAIAGASVGHVEPGLLQLLLIEVVR